MTFARTLEIVYKVSVQLLASHLLLYQHIARRRSSLPMTDDFSNQINGPNITGSCYATLLGGGIKQNVTMHEHNAVLVAKHLLSRCSEACQSLVNGQAEQVDCR